MIVNVDTGEILEFHHDEMMSQLMQAGGIQDRQGQYLARLTPEQAHQIKPMTAEGRKGYMRNQPCVCGSKKKFKKCCWNKYSHKKVVENGA